MRFEHQTAAQRVLFGAQTAAQCLAAEVERRKSVAPFVVAGDRYVPLIQQAGLGSAVRFSGAVEHVPVAMAQQARSLGGGSCADLLIAIGGGSATGLAKAIALTTGLSIVAGPTPYAGSAATNV